MWVKDSSFSKLLKGFNFVKSSIHLHVYVPSNLVNVLIELNLQNTIVVESADKWAYGIIRIAETIEQNRT